MASDWVIGTLVFAKLAKKDPYWPGLVVDPKDCGLENRMTNKTCVFWIGDNRVSMVNNSYIEDFKKKFSDLYNEKNKAVLLKRAILDAIEIFYGREFHKSKLDGLTDEEKIKSMILLKRSQGNLDVPANILYILKTIKTLKKKKSSDDDDEEENNKKKKKKIKLDASDAMVDVESGKLSIDKMCIVCNKYIDEGIMHPFFNGSICHKCKIEYRNSVFQMDTIGNKFFCIVCGVSEGQFQSKESFLWRFCKECSSKYFKAGEKDIHIKWTQHLKYNRPQNFLLTLNKQWDTNLTNLFCENRRLEAKPTVYDQTKLVLLCFTKPSCRKGLNKLKNLGFNIDNVEIKTLNDLKKDEIKTANIIVGKPCERNETWTREDRNNIAIKKIHTEFLLEFKRTVNRLKSVTWLYEMPAAIPSNFRDFATRHLWEVQPFIFKSADTSPLNEYRLVWTNMNQTTKEIKLFHQYMCHI